MLLAWYGGAAGVPSYPYPEEWYCGRAVQLDGSAGQLQYAASLLEAGAARGVVGSALGALLNAAKALRSLPPRCVLDLPLQRFAALPVREQLLLLLLGGDGEGVGESGGAAAAAAVDGTPAPDLTAELNQAIEARGAPFCRGLPPDERRGVLRSLLLSEVSSRPDWCAALVACECVTAPLTTTAASKASGDGDGGGGAGGGAGGVRLWAAPSDLAEAVTAAVMACGRTDCWAALQSLLDSVQQLVAAYQGSNEATALAGACWCVDYNPSSEPA